MKTVYLNKPIYDHELDLTALEAASHLPVDYSCYSPPFVPPGVTRFCKVKLPTLYRWLKTQHRGDVKVVTRENNNHVQIDRTVVTHLNRNHLHTKRIVTNENYYNHYATKNVVKVNDIHKYDVQHVPGTKKIFNKHIEIAKVQPVKCLVKKIAC